MRLTKSTQEKLQQILKSQGFTIRYEKGNFHGGHCLVLSERVIVINKFYPLESKINTLAELIRELPIDTEILSDDQAKWVDNLKTEKKA